MLYCYSTYPTCTISNLNCGTLYNFTVQASDGTCNSSFSDPVQRGAGSYCSNAVVNANVVVTHVHSICFACQVKMC